jgi:hypothetical protein
MTESKPISLRAARENNALEEFAREHDGDAPGDEAVFNRALRSMAGTSKEAPAASKPRRRDG